MQGPADGVGQPQAAEPRACSCDPVGHWERRGDPVRRRVDAGPGSCQSPRPFPWSPPTPIPAPRRVIPQTTSNRPGSLIEASTFAGTCDRCAGSSPGRADPDPDRVERHVHRQAGLARRSGSSQSPCRPAEPAARWLHSQALSRPIRRRPGSSPLPGPRSATPPASTMSSMAGNSPSVGRRRGLDVSSAFGGLSGPWPSEPAARAAGTGTPRRPSDPSASRADSAGHRLRVGRPARPRSAWD